MKDYFNGLIDKKTLAVINLFLVKGEEMFHINKVAEQTGVPLATTFRIINQLAELEIIEKKTIGKFSIYTLAKNRKTGFLKRIIK
ncbi:helix-turn-helix domain-containing protein [Candidatus Woesearchaeota archaeon]|nr:helix-turn-helix domain-containing protein [Candidatus Woesearchaeota archaeon]